MGSDETFDGGPLVSRGDVVVVTINYRLNIFGFLGLNNSVIPGNYAMADKIAALTWVKENIAAFGGDPEKVTIFGQSAGGWSVVDLLKSPKAAGLFHAAISQSGGSGTFTTYEAVYEMVGEFPAHSMTTGGLMCFCFLHRALPFTALQWDWYSVVTVPASPTGRSFVEYNQLCQLLEYRDRWRVCSQLRCEPDGSGPQCSQQCTLHARIYARRRPIVCSSCFWVIFIYVNFYSVC